MSKTKEALYKEQEQKNIDIDSGYVPKPVNWGKPLSGLLRLLDNFKKEYDPQSTNKNPS